MPKYWRKNRQWGIPYGAPPMPPMYPMPIPGFFPAVPMGVPSMGVSPAGAPTNGTSRYPQTHENFKESAPSKAERACLLFFDSELDKTEYKTPTDMVIIDFDRELLASPQINLDLFNRESRDTIEFKLGSGRGWHQHPAVLDAALQASRWDSDLLEIAKEAANSNDVILVITTARSAFRIHQIEGALRAKGVTNVDHFACSSADLANHTEHPEHEEHTEQEYTDEQIESKNESIDHTSAGELISGEQPASVEGESVSGGEPVQNEKVHEDEVKQFHVGNRSKYIMLELLMETYDSLERVFIYDGTARAYETATHDFVREGWLNGEVFHIAPILPKSFHLHPHLERQLVSQVLQDATTEVETAVVSLRWVRRLTAPSRQKLVQFTAQNIVNDDIEDDIKYTCMEAVILSGTGTPNEMRALMTAQGRRMIWKTHAYEIDTQHRFLFHLRPTYAGSERAESIVLEVARTCKDTEPSALAEIDGPEVEMYVYEHRSLRVQLRR